MEEREIERLIRCALRPWREDRDWDDLKQEARVRCWLDLQKPAVRLLPPASVVWRGARYAAIDYLRRRNKFPLTVFITVDDNDRFGFDEAWVMDRLACAEAMGLMRPREREATRLHYYHGKSFREIGIALGVNGKRAYQILQTGLDRSRQQAGLPQKRLNDQSRSYRRKRDESPDASRSDPAHETPHR